MTEVLKALLGCVQGEVSQYDSTGKLRIEHSRFTEHVVIPVPADGSHVISLVCKYCGQSVRVHVRSLQAIRKKRLATRLAMAVSVCLWSAAAALVLVYLLTGYPQAPGREVVLAGLLAALGAGLWIVVDGYDAFASDLALGCQIERSLDEKNWSKHVSREGMRALPCHVLLDPEPEPILGRGQVAADASLPLEARKPTVRTTIANPGSLSEASSGHSGRLA